MSFDRRTRIEQMRNTDRSRDRRNRVVLIGVSAVVVAGLLGFGTFTLLEKSEANDKSQEQQAQDSKPTEAEKKALADEPVKDEKSWDAKKLGRDHVAGDVKYPMKPPVGGNHNQTWLNCDGDVYEEAVPDVNAVHALEHGAVWVTYTGAAADADLEKLTARVGSTPYSLMSPYEGQAGAIMLSAWGKQVTVDSADDRRVAQFFAKYVQGPQTPEPGAPCTGGVGGTG